MKKLPVLLLLSVFSTLCCVQVMAQAEAGTGPTPLEQFKSTAKKHLKLLVEHSDKERNANFAKTQAEKMLDLVEAATDEDGFDVEEFKRIQISGAFLRKFSRARMDAVLKAHEKYEVDSAELRAALEEEKKKAAAKQAIAEAETKAKAEQEKKRQAKLKKAEATAAAREALERKQREAVAKKAKREKERRERQAEADQKKYELESGDLTMEQHVANVQKIVARHVDHAPVSRDYPDMTNHFILRKVTAELLSELDEYYYKYPTVTFEIAETRIAQPGLVQIRPALEQPSKSKYFPWKSVAVFSSKHQQKELKKGTFKCEFMWGQEGMMMIQMIMDRKGQVKIYNPAFIYNHLYFFLYPENPKVIEAYRNREATALETLTREMHQQITEKLDQSVLGAAPGDDEISAAKEKLTNELKTIMRKAWKNAPLMEFRSLGYIKYDHERYRYIMRLRHGVVKAQGKYAVNYAHEFYSPTDLISIKVGQYDLIETSVKLADIPEIRLDYDSTSKQWKIDYLGVFAMSLDVKRKLKEE